MFDYVYLLYVLFLLTIKEINNYKQSKMKSSFKKIDKTSTTQKGGFGHPDLDAIFSNSLPRGHLITL